MPAIIQEYRNPAVLKRIAELKALGYTDAEIADMIHKEFKLKNKPDPKIVKGIVRGYSVKSKEFLKKDKEIAELYRDLIMELINEGRENLNIMRDARKLIQERVGVLDTEIKTGENKNKVFLIYLRELQSSIRTQNDSIRTMKGMLEHLEEQKKEVKVSAMQGAKVTLAALESLEDAGYITINPDYKDSDVFKFAKEDENE